MQKERIVPFGNSSEITYIDNDQFFTNSLEKD